MSPLQAVTLTARGTVETGVVGALAYWGYQTGGNTATGVTLAIAAPAVGFGTWGAVDFHQLNHLSEPLRLIEELVISGLAAAALYAAGQPVVGWTFGTLSVAYHALVYLQGDRLIKAQSPIQHHDRCRDSGPLHRLGLRLGGSTRARRNPHHLRERPRIHSGPLSR